MLQELLMLAATIIILVGVLGGLMRAFLVAFVLFAVAFWAGCLYVLVHFAMKCW